MKYLFAFLMLLPTLVQASSLGGLVPLRFHANLTAAQEVAPSAAGTPANASGQGEFIYVPKFHVLYFSITFSHLSGAPTMSHFHHAASGVNGPVLQTICGSPAPALLGQCVSATHGQLTGQWLLSDEQARDLMAGDVYVNLHTQLNSGGEIRGQLLE